METMLKVFRRRRANVYINDEFDDIKKLKGALQAEGLESSNLIIGIDFTNCSQNEKKHTGSSHSHRECVTTPNSYEHVISIIGKALSEYDEDNKIPCFGFGDETTTNKKVFNFYQDGASCMGVDDVLQRYRKLLPHIRFSEPTSFAPIIYAAVDVVKRTGGQYHILVIIANGQVTGANQVNRGKLSPEERSTINAIVYASDYPLSIVLVGVGDGPWDAVQRFDDAIKQRKFDNFQFVNYTEIEAKYPNLQDREMEFALAALMEIPQQYKAIKSLKPVSNSGDFKAVVIPPPYVPNGF